MRAWQPNTCEPGRWPKLPFGLLSDKTVGSTHLTHGLEIASGPRHHRCHPDRPDQHPHSCRVSTRRWQDTRQHSLRYLAGVQHWDETCTGGHGTLPKEQNTQQCPGNGRSMVPQELHLWK